MSPHLHFAKSFRSGHQPKTTELPRKTHLLSHSAFRIQVVSSIHQNQAPGALIQGVPVRMVPPWDGALQMTPLGRDEIVPWSGVVRRWRHCRCRFKGLKLQQMF